MFLPFLHVAMRKAGEYTACRVPNLDPLHATLYVRTYGHASLHTQHQLHTNIIHVAL